MGAQGALLTLASPGESFCTVWRFQRGLKKEKSPYDMVASPLFPPYLPVLYPQHALRKYFINIFALWAHGAVSKFLTGHSSRFTHFSPTDSPYPTVKTVVMKA